MCVPASFKTFNAPPPAPSSVIYESITYEEFLEFDPCYLRNREKKA